MLILPGDPLFQFTLDTAPPPGWQHNPFGEEMCLVKDLESGLLRPATIAEAEEYIWGGELDEVDEKYGEDDDY